MERRYSRKREAILSELMAAKDHPGAEELFKRLKPSYPDLSLGTVYRNLTLFREEGTAMCVATVNGEDRFDGNTSAHPHFICDCCGRVDDIPGMVPDFSSAAEQIPGIIRDCVLTFYGTCSQCAGAQGT